MSFAIGQKVMCVHRYKHNLGRFNHPQFMNIYTVRAHCPCSAKPAILLEEIFNRTVTFVTTHKRGEASFAEWHFKALDPLDETEELEAIA